MAMSGSMPWKQIGQSAGLGAAAGGLGNMLFGNQQNPANSAMGYFNKIPGALHEGFDPWIQSGQNLMAHPGERLNEIGGGFQQSPGFNFAMQQALQGGNHAAAMGGMAGSPQHQMQNMQLATQLANQDYGNWMDRALGLHNLGYGQGQQAGIGLGENLASNLGQQGQYSYAGQAGENAGDAQNWEQLFGGVASMIPFMLMG